MAGELIQLTIVAAKSKVINMVLAILTHHLVLGHSQLPGFPIMLGCSQSLVFQVCHSPVQGLSQGLGHCPVLGYTSQLGHSPVQDLSQGLGHCPVLGYISQLGHSLVQDLSQGLGLCPVLGLIQVLLPSWVLHQTLLLHHSHCQGLCLHHSPVLGHSKPKKQWLGHSPVLGHSQLLIPSQQHISTPCQPEYHSQLLALIHSQLVVGKLLWDMSQVSTNSPK